MSAVLDREHVWRVYDLDRAGLSQAAIASEIAAEQSHSTLSESTIGRLLRRAHGFGKLGRGGPETLESIAGGTQCGGQRVRDEYRWWKEWESGSRAGGDPRAVPPVAAGHVSRLVELGATIGERLQVPDELELSGTTLRAWGLPWTGPLEKLPVLAPVDDVRFGLFMEHVRDSPALTGLIEATSLALWQMAERIRACQQRVVRQVAPLAGNATACAVDSILYHSVRVARGDPGITSSPVCEPGTASGSVATVRFGGHAADFGDRDEAEMFAKKLEETVQDAGSWPEVARVNHSRDAARQTVQDLQMALLEETLSPTLLGTSCRVCARSELASDSVSSRQ